MQDKILEMYSMLVEISSEIEGIKDTMARGICIKTRLGLTTFPIKTDAVQSKNNPTADGNDYLAVSFENLIQQVNGGKKQKHLQNKFVGVVSSDRNSGRYSQGTGGYSR